MGARFSLSRRNSTIQQPHVVSYTHSDALLIGLAGQKGVGKDSVADALGSVFYKYHRYPMRIAFAEGVKMSMSMHFGVSRQFIEQWKSVDENPPHFNMPMRKALQLLGEQMRKIQGDVWVRHLYNELRGDAVITDVRHENEIEAIRSWGGKLVLVVRGAPNDDEHISEATLKEATQWCIDNIQPLTEGGFVNMGQVQIPPDAPVLLHSIDYVVFNTATLTVLETTAGGLLEDIANEHVDYESDEGSLNI